MSLGVILLLITWLISPGIRNGFKTFIQNKPAMLMAGLFIIHVIWLLNTSDFDYALKDLRVKLPLLILALVLGSVTITRKQVKLIFLALSLGIWLATIAAYLRYINMPEGLQDYREIVQGVSHIRLSLLMIMLVMAVMYFWKELTPLWKIYGIAVILNTIIFFNILQSATGILVLITMLTIYALYLVSQFASRKTVVGTYTILFLLIGGGIFYSVKHYQNYYIAKTNNKPLETHTQKGNEYVFYPDVNLIENGNRTYDYFANDEMIEAWNERSNLLMSAKTSDARLNFTLIRYLTSKGLRKDYAGVMALTDTDIENIENGYPNEIYAHSTGLELRYHSFLFGLHVYRATGSATGSSFFQRLLFWKVAMRIIERNWLTGVGTGDVKNEITAMHKELHPELDKRYWLRAHNQFLTFFVAFGIIGFAYFLFLFGYTFVKRRHNLLVAAFLLIAFISCLTEDTVETQAGVTFFAFFFGLFSKPLEGGE